MQMLQSDVVGKCSAFSAEPGYGLQCTVSHINVMLTANLNQQNNMNSSEVITSPEKPKEVTDSG